MRPVKNMQQKDKYPTLSPAMATLSAMGRWPHKKEVTDVSIIPPM